MEFSRFWDISMPLKDGMMVWPGDPPFKRTARKKKKKDQTWTNSTMKVGCHTGTHMDAPRHVFPHGGDVNSIPLATLIGECRVVEIIPGVIGAEEIAQIEPKPGERLLFKTANSGLFDGTEFHEEYVYFNDEAAQALVDAQVVLIGTDGPSVDPYGTDDCPAHTAFCESGVAVIENLVLRSVEPGPYSLICLPLKLDGADGAPVRAILAR